MLELFCPDLYIDSIYKLDIDYIKRKKIHGLLVDLDNTLLPWNSFDVDEKLIEWVHRCKLEGISLCIVSNNKTRRITTCAEKLGIPAVIGAIKPQKKAFLNGLKKLGLSPDEVAVVGDQLFTDILGAKRMGIFAILVKPINDREFIWTKFVRRFERIVIKKLESKGLVTSR